MNRSEQYLKILDKEAVDWHSDLVSKLKKKGLTHEEAMNVLGDVVEYTQRAYMRGVNDLKNKLGDNDKSKE